MHWRFIDEVGIGQGVEGRKGRGVVGELTKTEI